jgi:hypothetical protein
MVFMGGYMPAQCKEAQDLYDRINKAVELIPKDFVHHKALTRALKDRQESIHFTSPSAMDGRIQEVANLLDEYLPDSDQTPWASRISEIFSVEYEKEFTLSVFVCCGYYPIMK